MGIIQKLRGELIDIVEWIDDGRETLLWRFPRYHNQIKNGAQLIVRPGQLAVFVHGGKLADTFEPGTYRLSSRNLPILSTLQGWAKGFESPFKAEVYFATTRQITELKWGTPNPVMVRDPDFGPIRIRAFGTFTLRARDPRALLAELVGTDGEFQVDEIGVLLRSVIGSCFADLFASAGLSILDVASNYADLSERLRRMVLNRVDDEFGLDLPQLYIVNVSVPEEVEKALDSRASMGIVGDLTRYQQYQVGRSVPVAAENPAGGLAGAGVGVGMGAAIAGQMFAAGGHPSAPHSPAASAAPSVSLPTSAAPPPPPRWYFARKGRSVGPLTLGQLAEAVADGRVVADTLVWTMGMSEWTQAADVPPVAACFQHEPPPIPPGEGE
jgi:membrane protease subunit (stomatin/prohibitin family)